jgi:hypothetical protein
MASPNHTALEHATEAESLKVIDFRGREPSVQPMKAFYAGSWSADGQLFGGGERGSAMTLALPQVESGRYRLALALTYAPDYGTLRVVLDGKPLGRSFDAYGPVVIPTGAISFGEVALAGGPHRLALEVVGKNSTSRGFLFGLGCIVLEPRQGQAPDSQRRLPGRSRELRGRLHREGMKRWTTVTRSQAS